MNKIRKIVLAFVACLPFAAVSNAASSKLYQLNGEEQNQLFGASLDEVKNLLFPEGIQDTEIEDLYIRVAGTRGLTNPEQIEQELWKYLFILKREGLVKIDTKNMVAGPSSMIF